MAQKPHTKRRALPWVSVFFLLLVAVTAICMYQILRQENKGFEEFAEMPPVSNKPLSDLFGVSSVLDEQEAIEEMKQEETAQEEEAPMPFEDASVEPLNPITIPDRGSLSLVHHFAVHERHVDYRMVDNICFISADDLLAALGYSYVHPGEGNTGDEGFIYDSCAECRYQKNGEVICFYKNTNNITIADQALVLPAPLYQPEDSPWEIFAPAEEFLKAMGLELDMQTLSIYC